MKRILIGVIGALALLGAQADLASAKKTLEAGSWTVFRDVDPMTDEIECTAIYKGNPDVQMTAKALYFRIPGVIESVTLRFGESAARATRLAHSIERRAGSVIVEGPDFDELKASSRFRYQVLTRLRGVQSGDLDLVGINEAVAHMQSKCPEGRQI